VARIELGAVAGDEAPHALHERLLASRGDEQHPQARNRLGGQAPGDGQDRGDRGEVVVGTGHHRPPRDVGHGGHGAQRDGHPGPAHHADPGERAERRERGAGRHERPRPQGGVVAGVGRGRDPGGRGRDARMEDQAGVGGVVVGDEDERALGARVPRVGHDVRRGAARQHPAHELAATRAVVVDEPGGRGGDEAGGAAAPARARPAGRGAREQPEAGGEAQRHVEGPARPLDLEVHPGHAAHAQLLRDPLGRGALPRRRGRALERRELLDERAQILGLGAGDGAHGPGP
jgi:hypothetical protein